MHHHSCVCFICSGYNPYGNDSWCGELSVIDGVKDRIFLHASWKGLEGVTFLLLILSLTFSIPSCHLLHLLPSDLCHLTVYLFLLLVLDRSCSQVLKMHNKLSLSEFLNIILLIVLTNCHLTYILILSC